MEIFFYLSIGLVVGIASGILGIGGGVLMSAALIWLCGLSYREAAGTTLAVLVLPVLIPAAWWYYQNDNVNTKAAAFVALAFGIGAFSGAWLRNNNFFNEDVLRICFGLMMMYVASNLIVISDSEATKAAAGLLATLAAWLAFVGLRWVGRRAIGKPQLSTQLQCLEDQGRLDQDYYI